jgi:hypothetical protein
MPSSSAYETFFLFSIRFFFVTLHLGVCQCFLSALFSFYGWLSKSHFHAASGLPDLSWDNMPKRGKNNKLPQNIPNYHKMQ